ncbi:hypothetical protein BD289DRAFT_455383 [Coniella lustricola]|uniref:DUF7730 domain-containing protein n=1 Tax=Coniella lustricola TaxID=2025994 RepID=A0A2T3A031_9PEZI|nr:hypothetical protein BD289DRAFT_455383 [Coniella lustricola]
MSKPNDTRVAPAQAQLSSPFFSRLPPEIRQQIYRELLALYPLAWHIHTVGGRTLPVFPCITDPDEHDPRYEMFQTTRGHETMRWESRMRSPYNFHWRCAEAATAKLPLIDRNRYLSTDLVKMKMQVPAPLLVCKRMYLESVDDLRSSLIFCFTDIVTARDFLAKHKRSPSIRNITISLRIPNIFAEIYYPLTDTGEPLAHPGGTTLSFQRNPWQDLCRQLSLLSPLRSLHIRLDTEDLRPWHKRVNEKHFFELLTQIQARDYVLYLPELPESLSQRGLPGYYLEGDVLQDAPFEVKRGPRPNNWQLHLSRAPLGQDPCGPRHVQYALM